jgi:hypothetical protein
MIVERNGRVYTFNSNRDGRHPPNWKDLVCEALSLQLYVMSNASQINKIYPLPEVVGPLNFMGDVSEKSETTEIRGVRENTRSELVDQNEESEQSDCENTNLGQKSRHQRGLHRGLPTASAFSRCCPTLAARLILDTTDATIAL